MIQDILKKAKAFKKLTQKDLGVLLNVRVETKAYFDVLSAANEVKKKVLGTDVYLPVPLYVSNFCRNKCLYCACRATNRKIERKRLTEKELGKEIDALTKNGFKIIELAYGDDPLLSINTYVEHIKILKGKLNKIKGLVALNARPFKLEEYKLLYRAGVDIIINWQETYNRSQFKNLHPKGDPKSNYDFRVLAQDRMLKAGIKNVGIGILFGLYDFKKDVISLVRHGRRLIYNYNISPIIGIPRVKIAQAQIYKPARYFVDDHQLKLAVAVLRLAMPHSHIFVSTRENKQLAYELLNNGGGNIFASKCSVFPGGYASKNNPEHGQFKVFSFSPENVCKDMQKMGYKPTFNVHPNNFNTTKKPPYGRQIPRG